MIFGGMEEWFVLLGRTHPLVVHLPIGIIFIALIFECLSCFERFSGFRAVLPVLWFSASITSIMACIAGWVLSAEGGFESEPLETHKILGIFVAVLSSMFFLETLYWKNMQAYLRALFATALFLVLSAAGHYGGTLTHGEDYLDEALLAALNREPEEGDSTIVGSTKERKPIENINEAVLYSDLIEPLLEQKCMKCHNAKKQKGKLRLDEYHFILAGGKSGSTLVPGNAEESEMYKRLLLPKDDKKRMPPKGKSDLTKEEIDLIRWWIAEAKASADKKVSEIRKPDNINAALAVYSSEQEVVSETEKEIPSIVLENAPAENIKALEEIGIVVNKFSADLPFLTVNCVNAPDFNDEQTKLLLPLKDHILWLKAAGTKIGDEGMANISQLKNLTRLGLEYNNISDEGMKSVGKLSQLRYLNLVGTKVTGASVASIAQCKDLRAVYLWQTGLHGDDAKKLAGLLKKTEINLGEH
jgi:uncharacterized membrane protein